MNLKHVQFLPSFSICSISILFVLIPLITEAQIENLENTNSSNLEGFNFSCFDCSLGIYPGANDFDAGQEGKVIIATRNDDNSYHSTYQNTDGKLTIKAVMHQDCIDQMVYFKVIDPDDQSPYENDTDPDDNLDISANAGSFGGDDMTSVMPELVFFNGQQMAVAEVELTITDQFSGDNYQVLVSLDNTFPESATVKSIEYIAWKRLYVELDLMYRYGATLTVKHEADANTDPDWLKVDNIDDFSVGQEIILFQADNSTTFETNILAIDNIDDRIQIPDLDEDYPKFAGIRINGIESIVNYSNEFITQGFGESPNGEDCGAFVEFPIWDYGNSGFVPKYDSFEDDLSATLYMLYWFSEFTDKDNVIYVLGALNQHYDADETAFTIPPYNTSIYFEEKLPLVSRTINIAEIINHELGHQLDIYDDNHPSSHYHYTGGGTTCSNEAPPEIDNCVMTYSRDRTDGIAKFDDETLEEENCHFFIRKAILPR